MQILVFDRRHHSPDSEIDTPLAQIAVLRRDVGGLYHCEYQTRILPGQPVDHRWEEPRVHYLTASDPHLARRGVGQKLYLPHPLAQVVEDRDGPFEQGATVKRRLYALRRAIEQR